VSGTFTRVISENKTPVYVETESPASLSCGNKELEGYGKSKVKKFGSPVGNPVGFGLSLIHMTDKELFASGIVEDEELKLSYPSGVKVTGVLRKKIRKEGKNLLFVISEAVVRYKDEVLHRPEDGIFYLAVGDEIISGYSGPADANAWGLSFNPPEEKTHKIEHNEISKSLHKLYQQVREIREKQSGFEAVPQIWNQLKQDYPDEWLLAIELLELARQENMIIQQEIVEFLEKIQNRIPEFTTRISNGLKLVGSNITNKSIGVEEV
jgi:phenylalanine-4-hydroxylase